MAETQQIGINPLNTLFVKFIVLAEGDQIAQQRFAIDFPPLVANQYAPPVRLAGHQTIALEQMAVQLFNHH